MVYGVETTQKGYDFLLPKGRSIGRCQHQGTGGAIKTKERNEFIKNALDFIWESPHTVRTNK